MGRIRVAGKNIMSPLVAGLRKTKSIFVVTQRSPFKVQAEGNKASPEDLEKAYRAKIENLRRCDKRTCVRAAYHIFFNERGSTRETYPSRWKAAWEYVKYYFDFVDLKANEQLDSTFEEIIDP